MRTLLAVTCSAGVAVVMASSAAAGAPAPPPPSDAAIAQYVEAVPSASGPVPVGEPAPSVQVPALAPTVRAKVERTAAADAPALIHIAEDPRYGARPVAHANPGAAGHGRPARPTHAAEPAQLPPPGTPGPFSAAVSTAGSGGLLLVGIMLVALTAAGIALRVSRR